MREPRFEQPMAPPHTPLWRYPPALAAVAGRLVLAGLGCSAYLVWRPEVTTPANSALHIREGVRLLQLGVSPYQGTTCHTPPLLLTLLAPFLGHPLLGTLPNIAADWLAAGALQTLAHTLHAAHNADAPGAWLEPQQLAAAYLWNPCALLACASGSTSPLENAAAMGALAAAASGDAPTAAFCVAVGAYIGLHPLLLLLPLGITLARGPEDTWACPSVEEEAAPRTEPPAAASSAAARDDGSAAASSTPAAQDGPASRTRLRQRQCTASADAPPADPVAAVGASGKGPSPPSVASAQPAPSSLAAAPPAWRRAWALLGFTCVWGAALVLLSDLSLRRHPEAQCLRRLLPGASGGGALSAHGALGGGGCWAHAVGGFLLSVGDYTPNIGLFWYFFTEMFEGFRPFFRFVFHSHALLMAAPLALRFPRRPLFLAWAQLLISCLFKPYPSVGDLVPWMALLPLLQQQLRRLARLGLVLADTFALLAVLGPAMWHQWIALDAANSNFFYSITLLFGAWQVLLLVQMVSSTSMLSRH